VVGIMIGGASGHGSGFGKRPRPCVDCVDDPVSIVSMTLCRLCR
jgi:hypothetical protein